MFTMGSDVNNFYRLYVSAASLYGEKKIGGTKTTLFTMTYDSTNHQQAPAGNTSANAMFTLALDSLNHYRIFSEAGALKFEKKVSNSKTVLGSVTYSATSHAFWRIRHCAAGDQILFETAPGNGGVPGTWTLHHSVGRELTITSVKMELKAGTWQSEANAPGTVVFDNFRLARP
jgi:hypothetical protein